MCSSIFRKISDKITINNSVREVNWFSNCDEVGVKYLIFWDMLVESLYLIKKNSERSLWTNCSKIDKIISRQFSKCDKNKLSCFNNSWDIR